MLTTLLFHAGRQHDTAGARNNNGGSAPAIAGAASIPGNRNRSPLYGHKLERNFIPLVVIKGLAQVA